MTRQRLQWASSVEIATTRSVRGDLWLFNHLAGGPVLEALEVAGLTPQAKAFSRCKGNSAKLKRRCYNATIVPVEVPLKPWGELLSSHTPSLKQIDLLVVDLRDPTVGSLLRSFPLSEHKPTFIYYRNGDRGVRKHLLRHGYQTSAHWETSAWGEHTLAWRADRCLHGRLFTP